jgi:protein-tyrosine phosphatase
VPAPTSILFVCLGNICRSPLAEGIFAQAALEAGRGRHFRLDSAGTGAWHVGSPPDPDRSRSRPDMASTSLRSGHGKLGPTTFSRFDLIFGMDGSNLADLSARAPVPRTAYPSVPRLCDGQEAVDVPDPYYGGADGFENVYRMIRDARTPAFQAVGAVRPEAARPPPRHRARRRSNRAPTSARSAKS